MDPSSANVENRTSKERAGWKTAQQKTKKNNKKNNNEKVVHRREKGALRLSRENRKKKQPQEKEATRNVKRGRTTLKRSKWRRAYEQAPTKALRSERNPQSDKKTKQLKPKFASKTALEKSPTKQVSRHHLSEILSRPL